MKSDPKECLYCQSNETLHNLMIEVAELSVSRVFIFKEQTYRGRCLVAYKDHVDDINLLSDDDRNAFMSDVVRVTRAMQKVFNPDKILRGCVPHEPSADLPHRGRVCEHGRGPAQGTLSAGRCKALTTAQSAAGASHSGPHRRRIAFAWLTAWQSQRTRPRPAQPG